MRSVLLTTAILLISVHFGQQEELSCPSVNYPMELNFRIIDQSTGNDLDVLQFYMGAVLDITGTISTNVPIEAATYTVSARMKFVANYDFVGIPLDVNEKVVCPEPNLASSSDPTECSVTTFCEQLGPLLGASSFSCPTISGVVNFQVMGLQVPPMPDGTIPSYVQNDWNPHLDMKLKIVDDQGTMISCVTKKINLDVVTH